MGRNIQTDVDSKKLQQSSRQITTALFILRRVEVDVAISDLDLLTIGMVLNIWTEKANDSVRYKKITGQSQFDSF